MREEKIIEILKSYFSGVYCDTCNGELEAEKCDYCHRKNMNWAISDGCAEEIASKIIGE